MELEKTLLFFCLITLYQIISLLCARYSLHVCTSLKAFSVTLHILAIFPVTIGAFLVNSNILHHMHIHHILLLFGFFLFSIIFSANNFILNSKIFSLTFLSITIYLSYFCVHYVCLTDKGLCYARNAAISDSHHF